MKKTDIDKVSLIAFYLPQFHPIPENDDWWGKGFTEWTNVTKAEPLFEGHYQPHLPADMGFYDLRVPEVMQEQAQLAKTYGIDGFCYHYYWFSGKRLLERPLDDMLKNPAVDMPFCLCWANENWTRRWDGDSKKILIAQKYRPEDDAAFINDLLPFFNDSRYIRLDGAPLLIVYAPQHLPDARRMTEAWRKHCRDLGVGEIHLCAALTHGNKSKPAGFDTVIDFPPHNISSSPRNASMRFNEKYRLSFCGNVLEYREIARHFLDQSHTDQGHFRTVFPSWDNTARTGERANVVINSSPENYEVWLSLSMEKAAEELPDGKRMVFINAWNEWAEGCHLEPDRRHARAYLEATKRARTELVVGREFAQGIVQTHVVRRRLLNDLTGVFIYHGAIVENKLGKWVQDYPGLRRVARWLLGRK
jgi:lipopolysaccharide biosynthesis protein